MLTDFQQFFCTIYPTCFLVKQPHYVLTRRESLFFFKTKKFFWGFKGCFWSWFLTFWLLVWLCREREMMKMEGEPSSSSNERALPNRHGFIDTVFSWSLQDILNENLFKEKVCSNFFPIFILFLNSFFTWIWRFGHANLHSYYVTP